MFEVRRVERGWLEYRRTGGACNDGGGASHPDPPSAPQLMPSLHLLGSERPCAPHLRASGRGAGADQVFEGCFLGSEGEVRTVLMLVERDRRTCADDIRPGGAPKKGLVHEHRASSARVGGRHQEAWVLRCYLMCDGDPRPKRLHEQIDRLRKEPSVADNSGGGDSQAK